MSSYDFPSAPSEGAVFAPPGGPSWQYDDGVWKQIANPATLPSATVVYDPPLLAPGVRDAIRTLALPGAALGDAVAMSFSLNLNGVRLEGWISAANTVSYVFSNPMAASINLASGVVRARLVK